MSTLYLECKMGAAGDMLMAALFELLDKTQQNEFLYIMNNLSDEICVESLIDNKCGIAGTHINVLINGNRETDCSHETGHNHSQGHHHDFNSVLASIDKLNISASTKENARSIYSIIGEAEARVHNTSLDNIHFHEVGSLDALADVVGNCLLIEMLNPDQIICSPIHVGNGTVKCAHGILPVPAPATAEILKGIPFYTGQINSELCTPTGAAIIKHFANEFDQMPAMLVEQIGIGLGSKDFPIANAVRAFIGESNDDYNIYNNEYKDRVIELSCNLDDMTGEEIAFACEELLSLGALDVFTVPIQMKKNRPGTLLKLICRNNKKDRFIELIFKYTSTRGIRYLTYERAKLKAEYKKVETKYGPATLKTNSGYGVSRSKLEYEDIKNIARENNISLREITNPQY